MIPASPEKFSEYAEFVEKWSKPLPTREARTDHAMLGIIGELGEIADAWKKHQIYEQPLNVVNLKEELGDFRFYLQMLINEDPTLLNRSYDENPSMSLEGTVFEMALRLKDAIDNLNPRKLLQSFYSACYQLATNETEIMDLNMAKLRIRYPNGYSNEHAQARLDKSEF